jgi:hypothetical protein
MLTSVATVSVAIVLHDLKLSDEQAIARCSALLEIPVPPLKLEHKCPFPVAIPGASQLTPSQRAYELLMQEEYYHLTFRPRRDRNCYSASQWSNRTNAQREHKDVKRGTPKLKLLVT